MNLRAFEKHFTTKITPEIKAFAARTILKAKDNYLIVLDKNRPQKAFCTACGQSLTIPDYVGDKKVTHKMPLYCLQNYMSYSAAMDHKEQCKNCLAYFPVVHAWRTSGLDRYQFTALLNIYEKSRINGQAITCRTIEFTRFYSLDGSHKDTYKEQAWYLFEAGKSAVEYRLTAEFNSRKPGWEYRKTQVQRVNDISHLVEFDNKVNHKLTDTESFKRAAAGTAFQYCCFEMLDLQMVYKNDLLIPYLNLFSKHPLVEVLIKMGLDNFVSQTLKGCRTNSVINWCAKRPNKLFRFKFTKSDFTYIRTHKYDVNADVLKTVEDFRKNGLSITFPEANLLGDIVYNDYRKIILHLIEYKKATSSQIYKYCYIQNKDISFSKARLRNWLDYVADCIKLNLDLDKKEVLFPKELEKLHGKLIEEIKYQNSKKLEASLAATMPARVKMFSYANEKYVIRPILTIKELIKEGTTLHHCVGSYANRYTEGRTNILVLRKQADPNTPYFTLEVRDAFLGGATNTSLSLIQIRGYMNCNPPKEVKAFADAFLEQLNKKIKGGKAA